MAGHYRLLNIVQLPEYDASAKYYVHRQSGAHVFHLHNKDPENLFAFCFATPPSDSTGIAHILEHTVLCGSEHFRLKDPFLQLLKGSVQSFLNAMTFPDRTIYPAASALRRDLFNMMRVYGDAVFRPRLQREMFMQEGHHTKINDDGALEISGVVYNEMIGASATHDHVTNEWSYRGLMPDTVYGHSSGGDPRQIPHLDYQSFIEFHRAHYHPSQSLIFLYGDIPTATYLRFLHSQFLRGVQRVDTPPPKIAAQTHWQKPRTLTKSFPYPAAADATNKSSVTVSWLLDEVSSGYDAILAEVLSEILIGNSGAPLYKAILDSPLGEDLSSSSGVESELKQLLFSVGIRGTDKRHTKEIQRLINDTLARIVRDGIDPVLVQGALFKIEFSMREIKSLQGLQVLRRGLSGWLYGQDPLATISVEQALGRLREGLARDPRLIETAIQRYLLDNPHALTLVVVPDTAQAEREHKETTAALRQRAGGLSAAERDELVAAHAQMTALQRAPEDERALAAIPRLRVRDMPREPRRISYRVRNDMEGASGGVATAGAEAGAGAGASEGAGVRTGAAGAGAGASEGAGWGVPLLSLTQHTNDIAYLAYAFDISDLTPSELSYIPFLTTIITEIGTRAHGYDELSRLINRYFGGLYLSAEIHTDMQDANRIRLSLMVRAKTLITELPHALQLLQEILTETDFSQYTRYTQILTEDKNEMTSSIVPAAHLFAGRSAASSLSQIGNIQERWSGVSQLKFLRTLADQAHLNRSQRLYDSIVGCGMLAAVSAPEEHIDTVRIGVTALHRALRERGAAGARDAEGGVRDAEGAGHAADGAADLPVAPAAYTIPSGGNYVGYAIPATRLTAQSIDQYVAESVLGRTLSTGVLWERIRMQGGAYGASASVGLAPGALCFISYRDPHVARTIGEFERALAHAAEGKLTKNEIAQTVVSITGNENTPLPPGQAARVALTRHLSGHTEQLHHELYRAYLRCSVEQVSAAAIRLQESLSSGSVAVIGESTTITEATAQRPPGTLPAVEPLPA